MPDQILNAVVAELRLYEIGCDGCQFAEMVKILEKAAGAKLGAHFWEFQGVCGGPNSFLEKVGDGIGEADRQLFTFSLAGPGSR